MCRSCHRERPVVDYLLQRHKVCMHCRIRHREKAAAWHAATPPPPAEGPGLTSTREGRNKHARERYRIEHESLTAAPPAKPPRIKWCLRCKQYKPVREFESYRVRICIRCDGPTAPWVAPIP